MANENQGESDITVGKITLLLIFCIICGAYTSMANAKRKHNYLAIIWWRTSLMFSWYIYI